VLLTERAKKYDLIFFLPFVSPDKRMKLFWTEILACVSYLQRPNSCNIMGKDM